MILLKQLFSNLRIRYFERGLGRVPFFILFFLPHPPTPSPRGEGEGEDFNQVISPSTLGDGLGEVYSPPTTLFQR